jgi:hypothetical protein
MAQANMWHIFMIALSSILIEAVSSIRSSQKKVKHALKNAINEFQNIEQTCMLKSYVMPTLL